MSIPVIEPHSFFGLKTGIKGNATYVNDSTILYPIGGVLALHDYNTDIQRYIPLEDRSKDPNIICMSPDRKMIAVAEKGAAPTISLYDLAGLQRIKGLVVPFETITAKEFISIDFTFDGKFLIAVVGAPDWTLLCYNWEEGKVESSAVANNPNNPGPVLQVCCNPSDNAVVCVVGPSLFRLLNVSESLWRQFGWQKADIFPITCACWLSFDRAMAGTQDGRLLLVESGELKAIYRVAELGNFEMKFSDDAPPVTADTRLMQTDQASLALGLEVRELTTFKKGFAFACGSGTVHVFEKQPKSHIKFHKIKVIKLKSHEFRDNPTNDLNVIQNISINPSEDKVLATTERSQIYSAGLIDPSTKQMTQTSFALVGEQLHHGPVIGLAMCVWKPIFITIGGLDRTVRVWNYQTRTQDMIKQYEEDVFSVALHPTGLYVLLGFSDKLRLMILLIDDIQSCREFSISKCSESSFSCNGHFFAAARGSDIQVYSTVSFELIYNLEGHSGQIRALKWTPTDNKLVSCGSEGGVYEWEMTAGTRVGEIVTRSCPYLDVEVMSDGQFCYAVGIDGQIKEINKSMIRRGIPIIPGSRLDAVVLSRSDQMLFVAGAEGSVFSVNYPIIERAAFKQYHMHDRTITKMLMTYDDQTIVTVSEDGTVCLWKLTFTDEKEVKMDPDFKHSTNILISAEELKGKNLLIKEQSDRLTELETEHSYVTRQAETAHKEKLQEVHENYRHAIEELKAKNETMTSEHRLEVNLLKSEIAQINDAHEQVTETLEGSYNSKLIDEYDKYKCLEDHIRKMEKDREEETRALVNSKQVALEQMEQQYEAQLKEVKELLEEAQEELRSQALKHEQIKQQIEDDADHEMVEQKLRYEQVLRDERDNNAKYRGEAGVMKKKFISGQKSTEAYKQEMQTAQRELQKSQQTIVLFEKDVKGIKLEVAERDLTIADKEKTIHELKVGKQQLTKYKYVLNYKITELKNQIKPKDLEIEEKKRQMREMEVELLGLQKSLEMLNLKMKCEKEKLVATQMQLENEQSSHRDLRALLHRMCLDLHNAAGLIQEPHKLKEKVAELNEKYNKDPEFVSRLADHELVQTETFSHRSHLEGAVDALRKQMDKKAAVQTQERAKTLKENTALLSEVNSLRVELRTARDELKDVYRITRLNGKNVHSAEAKRRLAAASCTQHQIHAQYQRQISDADSKIYLLKQEIQRLLGKLSKEGQVNHVKEEKEKMRVRLEEN